MVGFRNPAEGETGSARSERQAATQNMLWNHISEHDLEEDMRLEAKTEDLSRIKVARVERSGDISFIKAE